MGPRLPFLSRIATVTKMSPKISEETGKDRKYRKGWKGTLGKKVGEEGNTSHFSYSILILGLPRGLEKNGMCSRSPPNDFMVSQGYAPEGRISAHGQGYDLVERPALSSEERIRIAANVNIIVHPIAFNDKAYAFCCDNYIVQEGGAVRIHQTPQEVFVV